VISKLLLPETETPETTGELSVKRERTHENSLDAITAGTADGLRLAANVAAMLIVFLAFTALADALLGGLGRLIGVSLGLERLLSVAFTPLAWLLGVPSADVGKIGTLLGQKTLFNEFIAYSHMAEMLKADPTWLSERGRLVASYALCGFANFGSVGIQIGGYSSLAPERRGDLSRVALRAMFGGLLATCLVACVAGILL